MKWIGPEDCPGTLFLAKRIKERHHMTPMTIAPRKANTRPTAIICSSRTMAASGVGPLAGNGVPVGRGGIGQSWGNLEDTDCQCAVNLRSSRACRQAGLVRKVIFRNVPNVLPERSRIRLLIISATILGPAWPMATVSPRDNDDGITGLRTSLIAAPKRL